MNAPREFSHRQKLASFYVWSEIEFPSCDDYPDSLWCNWENRISQGHKQEITIIRGWKKQRTDGPHSADDWQSEEYWQTLELTNTMCAALVAAIWSRVERRLNELISISQRSLGLDETPTVRACDFYGFCKDKLGIRLDVLDGYRTVNAIRILNNAFKHNRGHYAVDDAKGNNRIEPELLDQWDVLGTDGMIDFTELPVRDLVGACNAFFNALRPRIGVALDDLTGGRNA